jgi:predicted SnoaL-like aldol condensation-catalyzing enzyme
MSEFTPQRNKAFVLEAFETLFNKKDFVAAETFWSSNYIQHSAHIPPGRDGLFGLIKSVPREMKYENSLTMAEGDMVMLHGRFSGLRTGSCSTLFALRMDWWRSTGTSLRTRSPGKSQPAAFQCSAGRFPPDDLPRGICAKPSHQRASRFGKPKTHSAGFSIWKSTPRPAGQQKQETSNVMNFRMSNAQG